MWCFFLLLWVRVEPKRRSEKSNAIYIHKIDHGAKWLKLFHQKESHFFEKTQDALFSTEDGLFSILITIDDSFKIHGFYEFLLEYGGEVGYNRWLQSKYLLETNVSDGNFVEGFEAINLSWPHSISPELKKNYSFLGIGISNHPLNTLLDGISDEWYYAIGQSNRGWCGGKLAGYEYNKEITDIILWIRVSDVINRNYLNPLLKVLTVFALASF